MHCRGGWGAGMEGGTLGNGEEGARLRVARRPPLFFADANRRFGEHPATGGHRRRRARRHAHRYKLTATLTAFPNFPFLCVPVRVSPHTRVSLAYHVTPKRTRTDFRGGRAHVESPRTELYAGKCCHCQALGLPAARGHWPGPARCGRVGRFTPRQGCNIHPSLLKTFINRLLKSTNEPRFVYFVFPSLSTQLV